MEETEGMAVRSTMTFLTIILTVLIVYMLRELLAVLAHSGRV